MGYFSGEWGGGGGVKKGDPHGVFQWGVGGGGGGG